MNTFQIYYRNTQGTLMRILNAVSRRALDIPYVLAEATSHAHRVTISLDVNAKQIGQLFRDWHGIVDVIDVRAGVPTKHTADMGAEWNTPHRAAAVGQGAAAAQPSA